MPIRELVDLQLAVVEQEGVTYDADFIQRISVLTLDAREPVHEHVVQEEDLAVDEANLELLGGRLADLLSIRTQVSVDLRAASVDVVLGVGLHSKHGLIHSCVASVRLT